MYQTLVIIDAQHFFFADPVDHMDGCTNSKELYANCIDGIVEEINLAKRRGDYIIFVEWLSNPNAVIGDQTNAFLPTHKDLLSLVSEYNKKCFVYKYREDGGNEVYQALIERKLPSKHIRIAGVYSGYCVKETTDTLAKKLPCSKIKIIKKATACYKNNKLNKNNALKDLAFKHTNISVI